MLLQSLAVMQMELSQSKGQSKPKAKASRPTAASDEQFSVVQYIIDETEIPWQSLAIDSDIKHGQIRQLNVMHREALTEQFKLNPPHMIELITVLDQGVHTYMSETSCLPAVKHPPEKKQTETGVRDRSKMRG